MNFKARNVVNKPEGIIQTEVNKVFSKKNAGDPIYKKKKPISMMKRGFY
jgi:hypothetical protein